MSEPDLPELPNHPTARTSVSGATVSGAGWTQAERQAIKAYALTAIAAERARADALQAEVTSLESALSFAVNTAANAHARADALEAALREVLLAQENYARCHAREVNAINNYSGGQAKYSRATIKATVRVSEAEKTARALLEKKT